jgi:predicted amidohydrolase
VLAAAVQLNSTEDADANLEAADRLVREAAGRGARLVVLPEKWNVLGGAEAMRAAAQPLGGPALSWAGGTARELGIDLIAGSVLEHVEGSPRAANTSVHFDPDGRVRAAYRKLHMFDVELDGVRYDESAHEQPGEELVLTELADGHRLGMTVCYDVRFPELFTALAGAGAELLSVPAAFTLPTTREHWEVLVRARAIECQCFVIAANQIGEHAPGRRSGGRSLIVDPWGVVLACAPDEPCVVLAELSYSRQRRVRAQLPSLRHRRPDAYVRPVGVGERNAAPQGAG